MARVESAEGAGILRQLLNQTVNPTGGAKERRVADESQEMEGGANGMKGPMALRRERLAEALSESGFVDIGAGSAAKIKTFVQHAPTRPEEVGIDVDPRTAAELATHMGAEATGDVNLVLRILARIDPERVATLLK